MCEKMELNANKIIRGQVWFVREDENVTKALRDAGSHVINGSRPYFIVNVNGPIVICCPMTTNTTSSDNNRLDIVFEHTATMYSGYSEGRIIVSQICTKNTFEFEKYLYTFDRESIDKIMNQVYEQMGFPVCDKRAFTPDVSMISTNGREEPKKKDKTDSTFKPSKRINYLEESEKARDIKNKSILEEMKKRLSKPLKKTEAVFRTKEEAILYLAVYGDMPAKKVSALFNINNKQAYRRKAAAKRKASE